MKHQIMQRVESLFALADQLEMRLAKAQVQTATQRSSGRH
jgi:hypothetical protein